jgi:xanthine dehydrogenase accessory factor
MSGKYQSAILNISSSNGENNFMVTEGVLDDLKYEFKTDGDEDFVYRENIGYKYRLYIVGGGHCALALSELMSKFDFYITVMDDRPGLNTMEQNIFANEKYVLENYEKVDDIIPSGNDVFVVVMTLGHRSDTVALLKLLDKKFAYLGSLGSDTKIDTIKENLRNAGIAETALEEIHAPIGLKINSHSAEEIALSIAAEIIQVRNAE